MGRDATRSITRANRPEGCLLYTSLPAGISLAALLLRGNRVWPGIFVGTLLLSIKITGSISLSIGFGLGNTLEAVLGAYLISTYANGINAFFKARDVLRFFIFAGVLASALCAAFGVSLLCVGGFAKLADFSMLWSVWWVGDMLGVLFVTPFLVLLLGHRHHSSGISEQIETAVLIAGLSVVCLLNFGPRPDVYKRQLFSMFREGSRDLR